MFVCFWKLHHHIISPDHKTPNKSCTSFVPELKVQIFYIEIHKKVVGRNAGIAYTLHFMNLSSVFCSFHIFPPQSQIFHCFQCCVFTTLKIHSCFSMKYKEFIIRIVSICFYFIPKILCAGERFP
jgi:hypothetical protein